MPYRRLLDDGELPSEVIEQFPVSQPDELDIWHHNPNLARRYPGLIYVPLGFLAIILIASAEVSFIDALFVLGVGFWLIKRMNER